MKVHVTKDDIARATPGTTNCPVARALNRAFPGTIWSVASLYARRLSSDEPIFLPAAVSDWIMRFDRSFDREKMEELEFDLELPSVA